MNNGITDESARCHGSGFRRRLCSADDLTVTCEGHHGLRSSLAITMTRRTAIRMPTMVQTHDPDPIMPSPMWCMIRRLARIGPSHGGENANVTCSLTGTP